MERRTKRERKRERGRRKEDIYTVSVEERHIHVGVPWFLVSRCVYWVLEARSRSFFLADPSSPGGGSFFQFSASLRLAFVHRVCLTQTCWPAGSAADTETSLRISFPSSLRGSRSGEERGEERGTQVQWRLSVTCLLSIYIHTHTHTYTHIYI